MKHKVCDLDGALLDAAVAKAAGYPIDSDGDRLDERLPGGCHAPFHPSTDWALAGPIIERERITVLDTHDDPAPWQALLGVEWVHGEIDHSTAYAVGPTPLIAACRAYVAAKLGDEVELP